MTRTALIAAVVALLLVAVAGPTTSATANDESPWAPAASWDAQEGEGNEERGRSGLDEVVIWSLVGLGIFAAVMGVFYYFKREVGGFPENPSWVAPITIMRSSEFPDEEDFGEQVPSQQAHAEH